MHHEGLKVAIIFLLNTKEETHLTEDDGKQSVAGVRTWRVTSHRSEVESTLKVMAYGLKTWAAWPRFGLGLRSAGSA